jgi:hypothetical protein
MAVLLFSCIKKKENAGESVTQQEQAGSEENRDNIFDKQSSVQSSYIGEPREYNRAGVYASEEEVEEIKRIINTNEVRITKRNRKIVFIDKADFGIPGGDNWIIGLDENFIFIYVINEGSIVKRYFLVKFDLEEYSEFDIMQKIPGTRIGNSSSSICDFNNDGVDEIFVYGFYGSQTAVIIWGYDAEEDDFVSYCKIDFRIIGRLRGPSPVEFMNYKGMDGFKVYYSVSEVAGGPEWVPSPSPRNNRWFFYTWDGEQKKYIEVEEVKEK